MQLYIVTLHTTLTATMQALHTCTHTQHCHTTPLSEQVTLQALHSHGFEMDIKQTVKLRLGHHENLATLPLEPSAPRASNLACFKDKRLSSLSQLQMAIAAVVLRGSTPKPSCQIDINLAEGHEVGHSIHGSGRVFCNVCLCDCKVPIIPCSQQQGRVRAIYSGMAIRWRDKNSITLKLARGTS